MRALARTKVVLGALPPITNVCRGGSERPPDTHPPPSRCRASIEVELAKREGEDPGPPAKDNKVLTVFMDDLAIPEVKDDENGGQVSVQDIQLVVRGRELFV